MTTLRCDRCGTELPPTLLRCPACGVLTHATTLEAIAGSARALEAEGHNHDALATWNRALPLLPTDAPQRAVILQRITALESLPAGSAPTEKRKGVLVGLGTTLLLLLSKAKFLLLGLTKLSTLLSMFAFFGVYWGLYGWKFGLGLVLSIYIHEMGHVAALRHYGIPASAPMFIPGLGALIRLKAHPPTPGQDARVGLAGPIWGAGAAFACLGLYALTGDGLFASLTHIGAVINAFNLIPVWQLDGARGIAPLGQVERLVLAACALGAFLAVHEAMFLFVAIGLAVRGFMADRGSGDQHVLFQFVGLLATLAYLASIRGPV